MIFDTDILIWVERGEPLADELVNSTEERYISIVSYMELIQGATTPKRFLLARNFLNENGFKILPLTENIGHRASIYIEEHSVKSGLRISDALIAATALENNLILATGNQKHFKPIQELSLHVFKP